MVSIAPAGSGSPAAVTTHFVVSLNKKYVLNQNIHRAGREYLPPATEVIVLSHHHHTCQEKDKTPTLRKLLYADGDRFPLLELFPSELADSIVQPSSSKKH